MNENNLTVNVNENELDFTLEAVSALEFQLILNFIKDVEEGTPVTVIVNSLDLENSTQSASLHSHTKPLTSDEIPANTVISVTQTATAVAVSLVFTLGLTAGNMSAAWPMINALQFIEYIPMMNLKIPTPLAGLFSSLNFAYLPNSFNYFTPDDTKHVNKAAKRKGSSSSSFLLNAGDMLTILLGSFIIFPLVSVMSKLCSSYKVAAYFSNKADSFKWNFFIRFLLEAHLELMFAAYLQVYDLSFSSFTASISSSLALLTLFVSLVYPFIVIAFTFSNYPKFETSSVLKQKFGSLFEEFKNDGGFLSCSFYSVFLIRRAFYMASLYLLTEYPVVQVVLCIMHTAVVSCR